MELITVERAANRFVAGLAARKMWLRLRSKGNDVARCTVERRMGQLGVTGVTRSRRVVTTTADPPPIRPADPIGTSPRRDRTSSGSPFHVLPDLDRDGLRRVPVRRVSRRILGRRAATSMHTALVLNCGEQAIWTRRQKGRPTCPAHPSHRRREPISSGCLDRQAGRGRNRRLGRGRRRCLRQRSGRVPDRAVQV
jgi:putative transposase